MYSHITRSETRSLFGGKRYRLTAQIHATPDELHIISHSRLGRIEVFHDPRRDEFAATAAAAHEKAKARGLFVTRARDATAVVGAELRSLIATLRALRAFNLNVADLIGGVTIQHKSLQAITEIEGAIIECIDHVDRFLQAARGYADTSEDAFAPGTPDDATVPPTEWTRPWRR
jgi:hypothetical protein